MAKKHESNIVYPCHFNDGKKTNNHSKKQNKIMQIHYPKIFLLTLFFTIGITLFSCTNKEANKKQNDKIVVIDSENNQNNKPKQISESSPSTKKNQSEHSEKTIEINIEEVVTKKTTSDENNSAHFVSTSAKTDMVKSIKSENVSNTEKGKKNSTTKKEVASKGEVPLNKNAELPGGIDQFYTFFEKEYKRPENTTKLKITISFAVEKNGSVTYLASEPAVDKIVETEIIRVLTLSPKWQPGEANGKKIKMQYSLPILLK